MAITNSILTNAAAANVYVSVGNTAITAMYFCNTIEGSARGPQTSYHTFEGSAIGTHVFYEVKQHSTIAT